MCVISQQGENVLRQWNIYALWPIICLLLVKSEKDTAAISTEISWTQLRAWINVNYNNICICIFLKQSTNDA